MSSLSKLRSLELADYYVLLWAMIMLPVVGVRLKSQGFKKTFSWAKSPPANHASSSIDAKARAIHLGKLINFVAIYGFYRANCLCRSLVLLKRMQLEGLTGELQIGVPKDRTAQSLSILDAHAWVEYEGSVVNDQADLTSSHVKFDFN